MKHSVKVFAFVFAGMLAAPAFQVAAEAPGSGATENPSASRKDIPTLAAKPSLSQDGLTLYKATPALIMIDDPNPGADTERIPPPAYARSLDAAAGATIAIEYIPEGGRDLWGEYCYSFPHEAKAAFNAAADIWEMTVTSSQPITVRACWAGLESEQILGYSGGGSYHRDFTGAPEAHTWYQAALANSLAGADLDPTHVDMNIAYNRRFNWYFGTDGNTPADKHDLMTVVLHEIGHGLHFSGAMAYDNGTGYYGVEDYDYPSIYDRFVIDGGGHPLVDIGLYPNPSVQLGNALTSSDLWFNGSSAMQANGGNLVKLYAPATWQGGSSYSHLDYDTFNDTEDGLMVWAVSSGESTHDPGPVVRGLFEDLGWSVESSCSDPPATVALISPVGGESDNNPTYRWHANPCSSWYYLWVNDAGIAGRIKRWYRAEEAGCGSGEAVCEVTPSVDVDDGNVTWWIQPWNGHGYGAWSDAMQFVVAGRGTDTAEPQFPTGTIYVGSPEFSWQPVSNCSWYYLWINGPSGNLYRKWFKAEEVGCADGIEQCSVTPDLGLSAGLHHWWVQTWNCHGYGPWCDCTDFEVHGTKPAAAKLQSPDGAIGDTRPTYRWEAVDSSTWYYLWMNGPAGNLHKEWYTAEEVGCAQGEDTCSVNPGIELFLGDHQWWVQTWNLNGNGPWSDVMDFTLDTAGFNEQFVSGNAESWVRDSGQWYTSDGVYYTLGVPEAFATTTYDEVFGDGLDYRALVGRIGCESCSNGVVVHADGVIDELGLPSDGYLFLYSADGAYLVFKIVGGEYFELQRWTWSDAIYQGPYFNELRVVVQGSSLAYYINGVPVWSGSDQSLSAGRVGLVSYADSVYYNAYVADWAMLNSVADQKAATPAVAADRRALNDEARSTGDVRGHKR